MSLEDKIPSTIVMCGHGDYGENANQKIRDTAQKCLEAGDFPDYLIYGNSSYAKHRRKHNFLIGKAPAFAYTFVNVMTSSTPQAVFVGNEDSRKIFLACMDYFRPEKELQFIQEKGSFAQNLLAGKYVLYGAKSTQSHTLLLNGDLPFMFDIDRLLLDKDQKEFDFIFDCNNKELQGDFLPRGYRMRLEYQKRLFWIKEPNAYLLNIEPLTEMLVDSIYNSRRIHDAGGGNWKNVFWDTFIRKGRFISTASIFMQKYFIRNIASRLPGIKGPFLMQATQAEHLITYAMKKHGATIRTKVKVTNDDPSAKKDLDSFGDWSYLNAMYHQAGASGFQKIYPHAHMVESFAQDMMPKLAEQNPIYKDFPAYMNEEFKTLGLHCQPFDAHGNFRPTMTMEESIAQDIELHMRFTKKTQREKVLPYLMEHMPHISSWTD